MILNHRKMFWYHLKVVSRKVKNWLMILQLLLKKLVNILKDKKNIINRIQILNQNLLTSNLLWPTFCIVKTPMPVDKYLHWTNWINIFLDHLKKNPISKRKHSKLLIQIADQNLSYWLNPICHLLIWVINWKIWINLILQNKSNK